MRGVRGIHRRLQRLVGNAPQDSRGPALPDLAGYAFEKAASFRPFELLSGNSVIDSRFPGSSESLHALSPEALAGPYVAFELELDGSGAGAGVMGPGLAVHGYFDTGSGTQQIVVTVNGNTRVVASSKAQAASGADVAVTVTENAVTLWGRSNGRWEALLTHRLDPGTGVDLRAAASMWVPIRCTIRQKEQS